MPKCPKCRKTIDHLVEGQNAREYYHLYLVGGEVDYDGAGASDPIPDTKSYSCPECWGDLGIYNQEKAIAFLKGE